MLLVKIITNDDHIVDRNTRFPISISEVSDNTDITDTVARSIQTDSVNMMIILLVHTMTSEDHVPEEMK